MYDQDRWKASSKNPSCSGRVEPPCNHVDDWALVNHLFLTRYDSLLKELYIKPTDGDMVGTFLSLHANDIRELEPEDVKSTTSKFPTATKGGLFKRNSGYA